MSNTIGAKRILIVMLTFVASVVLVAADIVVAGRNQNTNSSTTAEEGTNMNTNMGTTRRRARRRARRSARAAAMTTTTQTDTGSDTTTATGGGEQTDLSGTYTGTINYPEGGMTGDATLTITGSTFTLTSGSATATGRLSAVTTRGYTGVAMQLGDTMPATVVSLRARRTGNGLMLMSVPGEAREFSFSTGGGGVGRRQRGRRGATTGMDNMNANTGMDANTNTGMDANMNTDMTTDTGAGGPTTLNTNAGSGRRRARRRRATTNRNRTRNRNRNTTDHTNHNMNGNTPMQ